MSPCNRHWPLLLILLSLSGFAQAAFITNQIEVDLYTLPFDEGEKLGTISTGTRVDVISSNGEYARIRTDNNLLGWVPARYLSDEFSSTADIEALELKTSELQAELQTSRNNVASAQKKARDTAKVQAELNKSLRRIKELEATLKNNTRTSTGTADELVQLRSHNAALEQRLGAVLLVNGRQAIKINDASASTADNAVEETDLLDPVTEQANDVSFRLTTEWFIGSIISAIIIGIIIGFIWLDKRIRSRHGGFRLY